MLPMRGLMVKEMLYAENLQLIKNKLPVVSILVKDILGNNYSF